MNTHTTVSPGDRISRYMPLYIGVTDFTESDQVRRLLPFFRKRRRELMVGVMMSYKSLMGLSTKYAAVWPSPERLSEIFIDDPSAFNTLHYADYDGPFQSKTDTSTIVTALGHCGENIRAIQFDMIWPDPDLCLAAQDGFGINVILQVGGNALEQVGNDPVRMIQSLLAYRHTVSCVLLDRSMGKGKGMDAKFLRPFVKIIHDEAPHFRVAVAGGLGPDSLHLVEPLMKEFPDLSIDAQGQLRPSGSALDPIDWERAYQYIRSAVDMFP